MTDMNFSGNSRDISHSSAAYHLVTRLNSRSANFALEHFLVINQGVLIEVHRCVKYFPLLSCYAQTSVLPSHMVVSAGWSYLLTAMDILNPSERCTEIISQLSFHDLKNSKSPRIPSLTSLNR